VVETVSAQDLPTPEEGRGLVRGCIVKKWIGKWGPYLYAVTKHNGKQTWTYLGRADGSRLVRRRPAAKIVNSSNITEIHTSIASGKSIADTALTPREVKRSIVSQFDAELAGNGQTLYEEDVLDEALERSPSIGRHRARRALRELVDVDCLLYEPEPHQFKRVV